jgi:hypothetical protein
MERRSIRRIVITAVSVAALLAAFAGGAAGFTSWSIPTTPNPNVNGNLFKGVSARTATDVWAVGGGASPTNNRTLAARWTGAAWTTVATPNPSTNCQDGNIQWAGNTLNAVASISATNAWAVGHGCYSVKTLAEHWNGSAWSIVPSPSFNTGGDGIVNELNGVAAISASDVWAVGTHTAANGAYLTLVEHWDGTRWSVVSSPNSSATSNVLRAAAATGASDVWAVGNMVGGATLIEHWDGRSWTVVGSPALPSGSALNAVTAISPTNAWAVGSTPGASGAPLTLVLHWNGVSWSVVPSPNVSTEYGSANVLRGVAAISSTDVWAVGMFQNESTSYHQHRTLTIHWNGVSWSVVSSPTPGASGELNAVSALATGQLWAAGLDSPYAINIYDGTYSYPKTLVLRG